MAKINLNYFLTVIAFILLSSCGGGGSTSSDLPSTPTPSSPVQPIPTPGTSPIETPTPSPSPAPGDLMTSPLMVPSSWEIGPIISGKNYSRAMPLHPTQTPDGWAFDFPMAGGTVNYVTYRFGSLAGKTHIVLKYRVEADDGVQFHPTSGPTFPSIGPVMYFQQRGDDWNTDGMRWWATFNAPRPIKPGEYELDIPLDGPWTSVFTMQAVTSPDRFKSAKLYADRVGFTFGGGTGYGHGVYADGRARFVVTSFTIE